MFNEGFRPLSRSLSSHEELIINKGKEITTSKPLKNKVKSNTNIQQKFGEGTRRTSQTHVQTELHWLPACSVL